jgi:2OG-Fe dioxygenase
VSAVSVESVRNSSGIERIWAALERDGYIVTSDAEIGLPAKFCENFQQTYFNEETLRHDPGDMPPDRLRARDVIRYQWLDGLLKLKEYGTITITDRAEIPGERDHSRVHLLSDRQARDLVIAFLNLVPPTKRQPDGTFGINLFRTFTNVVTKPHHDDEEYIILYVLDRIGSGAETYLYEPDDVNDEGEPVANPVLRRQLNPGEIIVFKDKCCKHGATPLEAEVDGAARRDVLVCTVDYWKTYLGKSA